MSRHRLDRFVGWKTNLRVLLARPGVFAGKYRCPIAILLLGAVLDAATTLEIVGQYGPETEVHPAQRLFFHWFGVGFGVPVAKAVQVGGAVFVGALWRRGCGWLMLAAGLLYTLAAASNHFRWL